MGVRFACHQCGKRLNVKQELAGRRGVCPDCATKFRIPAQDADFSLPLDDSAAVATAKPSSEAAETEGPSDSGTQNEGQSTEDRSEPSPVSGSPAQHQPVTKSGAISLLAEADAEATWYVRPPSGGQFGPATTEVLRQWASEGRIAATALVWRDGWPQWRQANEAFPELAEHAVDRSDDATVARSTAPAVVPGDSNASRPAPAPPRGSKPEGESAEQAANQPETTQPEAVTPESVRTEVRRRTKPMKRRWTMLAVLVILSLLLLAALVIVMTGQFTRQTSQVVGTADEWSR
ncbi:MAG: DUF4339 domain-containing protein [Planctomycetota bacterium]